MSENRLANQTSPYLLQHKGNPVHWWPWGEEALQEAKTTGKPILLSIGYAACHWCHVMAHESFEDPATAEVMNGLFVNIKVDREERPDIDAIYMGALHRLGEQGGWPLTMFLDSNARPFWGGTYFPKQPLYGRPSFVTVLLRMAEAYQNQPDDVASNAAKLIASLESESQSTPGAWVDDLQIADLITRLAGACDPTHGGLAGAPKFPQWNVFWLLWRGAIAFDDAAAREAVITMLRHVCQGGIYDHVGGGFSRYSVDERWLVPHFEKMLYDNALLIDLMTEVWRETQDPLFALRIEETVAWLQREMIAENGAFAASLDADSEGEEGKFYVWKTSEMIDVLGEADAATFAEVYDITDAGNFEGANIPNRLDQMSLGDDTSEDRLRQMRDKLLKARSTRVRPGTDDKVLCDWNGLMIAALARAGIVFGKPEWCSLARQAFDAVVASMTVGNGRLAHSWRAGKTNAPATASDYANMTWAAIRLYEAYGDAKLIDHAKSWTGILDSHYWDERTGGYFTAADDTADVIVRMKSAADDAVPNANAIQLSNLFALSTLTGDIQYEQRAADLLASFAQSVTQRPVGHCGILAASLDRTGLMQVIDRVSEKGDRVSVGDSGPVCQAISVTLASISTPGALLLKAGLLTSGSDVGKESGNSPDGLILPAGFARVTAGTAEPNAFDHGAICAGHTCLPPARSTEEFHRQLKELRQKATVSVSETFSERG